MDRWVLPIDFTVFHDSGGESAVRDDHRGGDFAGSAHGLTLGVQLDRVSPDVCIRGLLDRHAVEVREVLYLR